MKAVRIHDYGDVDRLVIEDVAPPSPAPNQSLVKVRAVSVNPFDITVRTGAAQAFMKLTLPIVVGSDFAGETVPGGERVFGVASGGSHAEFAVASHKACAPIPEGVDFEMAAALPVAGMTAYQLVTEAVGAGDGTTLLVHGAAGGVGAMVVQIAIARGAHVIAVASGEDAGYLASLGVERTIDYKKERFENVVGAVDAVIDLTRGDALERSYALVKERGVVATPSNQVDEARAKERGIRSVQFLMRADRETLVALARMSEGGTLRPRIDRVMPLEEIRSAQTLVEKGHAKGKVVLTVA